MSLRMRLALVVVGLVAVGLVVSDLVTYTSLRSFLTVRLDQQLQQAVGPVARALQEGSGPGTTGPSEAAGAQSATVEPPPGAPSVLLPPGTYGELRAPDGTIVARVQFDYGDTTLPVPDLPAGLPAVTRPPEVFTVAGTGASVDFRVLLVHPQAGPGTIVVAVPLTEVWQTLERLLLIELLLTAGVLLGLALLSWWMVRRGLRPLERMGDTAEAIARGDLSRRVEVRDPRTEVGRLGLALNSMLAQIERAFDERLASEERLRRFLADASHELRTPVTSIRGYAELFRRGARQRPEDLATSLRRIEQEATRMGVLVDDMLQLARLDQARPLQLEPVDLKAIASDAVDDARAADPEREIVLTAPERTVVLGDEDRLRQVSSNLVENALTHTPAGSPVEVAVGVRHGQAFLEVADRGRGVSSDEAQRVFEPFYRSDVGRSRDRGGSGLGLAIVAAIAGAHGGRAEVMPRLGGGALFRVTLPLTPDAAATDRADEA